MILEIENVSKRFGGLQAVDKVSLGIREGEIVGLIGANGAGKSTLFNLIAGMIKPDKGNIRFQGVEIAGKQTHWISRQGIAKTFQLVKSFDTMSVKENVMVSMLARNVSFKESENVVAEILEQVDLLHVSDETPLNLPFAYRRRIELARALATRPKLLLLDEVLAGLNTSELEEFLKLLRRTREMGVTLFLIEHILHATMTLCERIIVLDQGKNLAEGDPQSISRNPEVMKAYLGKETLFHAEDRKP